MEGLPEEYRIPYSTKTRRTCPSPATAFLSTLALTISLPPGLRMEPWYSGCRAKAAGQRQACGERPAAGGGTRLKSHEACVNSICWHPAGDPPYLLSASMDKTVALDRRDPEEPQHAFPCRAKVHCVSFNSQLAKRVCRWVW